MLPVRFSQRAKRDVLEIQSWIRGRSSEGATKWLAALEQALRQLSVSAVSCPAAPEADEIGVDLKQRLFKTRRGNSYRLLFIIESDTVQILAVRGSGQDLLNDKDLDLPE